MERQDDLLWRLAANSGIAAVNRTLPVSRFIRARDGLSLHYLDWSGPGEPIVFLHGGMLTAHTWDLVSLALRDSFRCIALDLRGHGLSDWSDDYRVDTMASDLDDLVTHLGCSVCHIVGMSLGGGVAGHYVARKSSRAASLVMVDVGPEIDFRATAGMREFMFKPLVGLSVERLIDEALEVNPNADRDRLRYRYAHMTRSRSDGSFGWCHDDRRSPDFQHILSMLAQLADLAPRTTCAALVVRGERSRVMASATASSYARRFGAGQWVTIPGAGHNIQEDNPKALAEAIRVFLAQH